MNYTRSMHSSPSSAARFVVPDNVALGSTVGAVINSAFLAPEEPIVRALAGRARLPAADAAAVQARGLRSLRRCAPRGRRGSGLDAFLREYHLASPEGVILMCLAEALLRIPDAHTADRLIADKIAAGAWEEHLGDSDSLFVNASTWGLMLTGSIVDVDRAEVEFRARLVRAAGEPHQRAGGARGAAPGDAHPRTPVRHGPHASKRRSSAPPGPRSARTAIRSTCWARPR